MWRLFNLLPGRRRRMERELDRELRYHVERRVSDRIRSGLTDSDARRQVALEFGGVTRVQEEVRDTWLWRWLDEGQRDLKHAGRILRRSPAFAVTALLSLALGIGASAAVFSLVDQVLLRRLPVDEPDRLVYFNWKGTTLSTGWGYNYLNSYPLCQELREQQQVFDGVFCRHPTTVTLSLGNQREELRGDIVSGSYFSVLGVQPQLGRLIDPSDDIRPGGHPVVVLAHSYWQSHLAGDAAVIGRNVSVNGYPMTVIGVTPAGFAGVDPLAPTSLWMPAMMAEQAGNIDAYWNHLLDRRAAWLHVFGRLKPGLTLADAKAKLQPWFQSMLDSDTRSAGFPSVSEDQRRAFLSSAFDLESVPGGVSGGRQSLRRPLWVIMAGTALLLLLASLNVAGLLLARGAARAREFRTRLALGATRGRIAGQLLVESVAMAVAGGALGVLSAPLIARGVLFFLSQDAGLALQLDRRVLAFACLASLATAVVCGLAPALQMGRAPLVAAPNERSLMATASGVLLRKMLASGQLAFTFVLLVGAGLFVQTVTHLRGNLGFEGSNLLMVSVNPPSRGYAEPEAERVMRDLLHRIRTVPVVERAAIANSTILTGGAASSSVTIQSDRRFAGDRAAARMRVGPGLFATLGTPVVAGRDFDERDVRPLGDGPRPYRSVIVSESFVRRYFRNQNPIGARIGLGNRPDTKTEIEIIGVVRNFSRRSLRDEQVETIFLQYFDSQSGDGTIYVRARGDAENAVASIRAAITQVDPELPVTLTTLDAQIGRSLRTERMLASLSTAFGALALLIAVIGLYGAMSFAVAQRTQEIGVRMALGASRASAVWLVLREALVVIAAGTLVALPSVWALRRFVEAELFGVSALHLPTIAIAGVVLAVVGLAAATLPAWRAASVNPTQALRL